MSNKTNHFSDENTYKLYRDVEEILHPVISKKNISDYEIVFDEKYLPVRVFYPKKVSFISKVMLFIPGIGSITECENKYISICKEMALETDHLVIAIDYLSSSVKYPYLVNNLFEFICFLMEKLKYAGILDKNITFVGDSIGANLISLITFKNIKEKAFNIKKIILLYPVLSGEYFKESNFKSIEDNEKYDLLLLRKLRNFYENSVNNKKELESSDIFPLKNLDFSNHPKTLIITGNLDPLRDEGYAYYEKLQRANILSFYYNLNFEGHGFLKNIDMEMKRELYEFINDFLKK